MNTSAPGAIKVVAAICAPACRVVGDPGLMGRIGDVRLGSLPTEDGNACLAVRLGGNVDNGFDHFLELSRKQVRPGLVADRAKTGVANSPWKMSRYFST